MEKRTSQDPASKTFAQAYEEQKVREMRKKTMSRQGNFRVTSMQDLDQLVQKILSVINGPSKNHLVMIQKLINVFMPDSYRSEMASCRDEYSLDILHYCILNDLPDVISYLLGEARMFPPSHQPAITPYAHLAASIGHAKCLKEILTHRPKDFFVSTKPSHVIKLPDELMKKFKLNESPRTGMNKYMDRLLDKIKATTDAAERAMESGGEERDLIEALGGDISQIEEDKKRLGNFRTSGSGLWGTSKAKFRPSLIYKRLRIEHPKVKDGSSEHGEAERIQSRSYPRKDKTQIGVKEDAQSQGSLVTLESKIKKHRHTLTVYRGVLDESPLGVLEEAGEPVNIIYETKLPQVHHRLPSASSNKVAAVPGAKVVRKGSKGTANAQATAGSRTRVTAPTDPPGSSSSVARTVSSAAKNPFTSKQSFNEIASTGRINPLHKIEMGVRIIKKYKEFKVKLDARPKVIKDESSKFLNKTPLTMAAERGFIECVQLILDLVILKKHPRMAGQEPLTLATHAKSPEAILVLLEKKMSRSDYQSAVLMAIRELYPDCLAALLSNKGKEREQLFDGTSLLHILYTQSLISNYRYEMMPELTRVLIESGEHVNSYTVPQTFPLYTLINCAFNISIGKQIFYYLDCLELLLKAKANPHYDEEKKDPSSQKKGLTAFSRMPFSSAMHCVFESANNSVDYLESPYWSKVFLRKIVLTIEQHDMSQRRILNDVLFTYMAHVTKLGLDASIIKCLLRYGANPDHTRNGKYAINVYFDHVFPYLVRFKVVGSYDRYLREVTVLMHICRFMSYSSLKAAVSIFMNDHLLTTPLQALPICRYFCWGINQLVRSPRSLGDLVALNIWLRLRRNAKKAKMLKIPEPILALIMP